MSITHENEKSLWVAVALWLITPALGLWYAERLKFLPVFIIWIVELTLLFPVYLGCYTSFLGVHMIGGVISLVFLGWTIHAVKQFNANLKKSHT